MVDYQLSSDFVHSVAQLANSEQKKVIQTVCKMLDGHEGSGLRRHKIDHPSSGIQSYSAGMNLRLIAYEDSGVLTFMHADHHDAAYAWASRRRFFTIDNTIKVVTVPEEPDPGSTDGAKLARAAHRLSRAGLLEGHDEEAASLMSDDEVLEYLALLPLGNDQKSAVLERLLHSEPRYRLLPDVLVCTITNDKALSDALKYPLDLWRIFLHPTQREVVERPADESVLITGGPGTGKTVCLVQRAARIARELRDREVVVVATYSAGLADYLVTMLNKLLVDMSRVLIVDVLALDDVGVEELTGAGQVVLRNLDGLGQVWQGATKPGGCLLVQHGGLWFAQGSTRARIRHLLVDECQDYRDRQLGNLSKLAAVVPISVAFDYTQAIYRRCPREAELLRNTSHRATLVKLGYCYRLNQHIVGRLKAVVQIVRVLSQYGRKEQTRPSVDSTEDELLEALVPAIDGTAPTTLAYQDDGHLSDLLLKVYAELRASYEPQEIAVTTFMPELYKHGRKPLSFGSDLVPGELRNSYRFVYTLKGQEYKAGIVVLDHTIAQMLNLNLLLLAGDSLDGFRGDADNLRRMYNLLYVSLSRFRDYLAILYPAKHEGVLAPLFRDLA